MDRGLTFFIDGYKCPVLGLGTFQLRDPGAIRSALDVGYRHIDTALMYENEAIIGDVLQEYFTARKLRRSDVFITCKLEMVSMLPEDVVPALENDLKLLKVDFVDLFLVHLPTALKNNDAGYNFVSNPDGAGLEFLHADLTLTWKGMEECVSRGLARSIGVSNFTSGQMRRVWNAASIKPVVNQIEMHPYLQQRKLRRLCSELGVKVVAFAPVGAANRPGKWLNKDEPRLLTDPLLMDIAKKHNKTVAQVCIRFCIECGVMAIPKSSSVDHQRENLDVFNFTLDKDDMAKIENIPGQPFRYYKATEFLEHPEYPFHEDE